MNVSQVHVMGRLNRDDAERTKRGCQRNNCNRISNDFKVVGVIVKSWQVMNGFTTIFDFSITSNGRINGQQ